MGSWPGSFPSQVGYGHLYKKNLRKGPYQEICR